MVVLAIWGVVAFGAPSWFPSLNWDPTGPDTLLAAILVGVTWFYAAETSQLRHSARAQVEIAESEHRLRRPHLAANIATRGGVVALAIANVGGTAALDVVIDVQFYNPEDRSVDPAAQRSPKLGFLLPNDRIYFEHPQGLRVETGGERPFLGRVAFSGEYRTTTGDTLPILPTDLSVQQYMTELRAAHMKERRG